jgi:L-amino acid N-acyltransferase YncA
MAVIRLATIADAADVASIYRPAVTDLATSFELDPPNAATMAERISKVLARTPWLVCEHEGNVLGYAYGGTHRERAAYQWTAEVSAYVRADAHRAGVGRALYTSLFAILALQGFRTMVAGITLPNPGSVGLHEAVGFKRVGIYHAIGFKFGQWHDVMWLERPLDQYPSDPAPPIPLSNVKDTREFESALAAGTRYIRLT